MDHVQRLTTSFVRIGSKPCRVKSSAIKLLLSMNSVFHALWRPAAQRLNRLRSFHHSIFSDTGNDSSISFMVYTHSRRPEVKVTELSPVFRSHAPVLHRRME